MSEEIRLSLPLAGIDVAPSPRYATEFHLPPGMELCCLREVAPSIPFWDIGRMEISSRSVASKFFSLTFIPIRYQVAWSKRNKRGFGAGKPLDCICKSLSPAKQKKVFVCNLD